tara:strand:+ start:98 stop:274 length:177 start_codon:yes stop_codon:yes gene_type:complete
MKKYKVVAVTDFWSPKKLAQKSEKVLNQYAEEGWELFSIQYRPWGYCNMITFSKNQSQ